MRRFGTQGPVNPQKHYIVSRPEEIADFINRVEQGKCIALFAPRQTGKTTFFQVPLKSLRLFSTGSLFFFGLIEEKCLRN